MAGLFYAVAAILVALWVYSVLFAHVGGPAVHVLLIGAIVIAIYQWLSGRRPV